jgi:hypothetical protein
VSWYSRQAVGVAFSFVGNAEGYAKKLGSSVNWAWRQAHPVHRPNLPQEPLNRERFRNLGDRGLPDET